MKTLIKVVTILFFFTFLISCNKEPLPTPIKPEKEIQPGSRDYVWDETVLEIPAGESGLLRSMWGSSPNDIWAVGDASLSQLGIWHYDGAAWKNGVSTANWGQTSVWGTSTNNIWMSNITGFFWHYNGTIWEDPVQIKVEGNDIHLIQRVWGISANEIYACGFAKPTYESTIMKGILFRYDGKSWNQISIPDNNLNFIHIRKSINGDLIIYALNEYTGECSFYIYDNNIFNKIFITDDLYAAFERIGDQLFFSKGQVIYEYSNKSYKVWKDLTGTEYEGSILGYRNSKDIFTRTIDGKGIGHYNGNDFKVIYNVEGSRFFINTGIAFEKDVYFLIETYNPLGTKILHGRLKE